MPFTFYHWLEPVQMDFSLFTVSELNVATPPVQESDIKELFRLSRVFQV
jgi:hypothetical protein